jgi:glycosyltransferase involved in cell wall biosynthesis
MLSQLRSHYGELPSPRVVYNARRTDSLVPLPREDFVITAGRLWDEAKNTNVLDVAAKSIEWPVFAAGAVQNPDGGAVGFESVKLLGELSPSDLGRWMGRASIYALPAKYEPFGLTALEAAHAGCALVLGDISSLREIWQDAAVFVPPNDSHALSEAVNRLIGDRRHLNEMAARAEGKAAEFTLERMTTAYLGIYAGMLSTLSYTGRDRPPSTAFGQVPSSKSFDKMTT